MKTYLPVLLLFFTFFSCKQTLMKTPENAMAEFEAFKQKKKFVEDLSIFYPGLADPSLRPMLTEKINKAAEGFREVAAGENPSAEKYQEKIGLGLQEFSAIYISLDTEERERICGYFEELMDIVGLESSDGQLNEFLYGVDFQ